MQARAKEEVHGRSSVLSGHRDTRVKPLSMSSFGFVIGLDRKPCQHSREAAAAVDEERSSHAYQANKRLCRQRQSSTEFVPVSFILAAAAA